MRAAGSRCCIATRPSGWDVSFKPVERPPQVRRDERIPLHRSSVRYHGIGGTRSVRCNYTRWFMQTKRGSLSVHSMEAVSRRDPEVHHVAKNARFARSHSDGTANIHPWTGGAVASGRLSAVFSNGARYGRATRWFLQSEPSKCLSRLAVGICVKAVIRNRRSTRYPRGGQSWRLLTDQNGASRGAGTRPDP